MVANTHNSLRHLVCGEPYGCKNPELAAKDNCDACEKETNDELWNSLIDELSDVVGNLVHLKTPELAYSDAYQKMLDAMEEFAVAHYG